MKEKILAYVKDNCLFVSVIAVLMVIFCFFLWMTYCAGNSMEAETSYTDVTAHAFFKILLLPFSWRSYHKMLPVWSRYRYHWSEYHSLSTAPGFCSRS